MTRIIQLKDIQTSVDLSVARQLQGEGFIAFSQGDVLLPEVGELSFKEPAGEAHIKPGYIKGDSFFVVKIATCFYENARTGQSNQDGAVLVHERATGKLTYLLLDHGWLTDLRTALAGALVADRLAPEKVNRIGILGTGTQARLQVIHLKDVVSCRKLAVWGRTIEHAEQYANEFRNQDYDVTIVSHPDELAECELIITSTPSATPLLRRVNPGTHVTCIGTDSPQKGEIDPQVLAAADLIVVDSIHQCLSRGDLHNAVAAGAVQKSGAVELGALLADSAFKRNRNDITIADLTGLAVQDISMAKHIIENLPETA